MVGEVDEGLHVTSAPMTVGELVDRWLETKASEANTERGYQWVAEHELHKAEAERDVSVNFLVTRAVLDYLRRLPSVSDAPRGPRRVGVEATS